MSRFEDSILYLKDFLGTNGEVDFFVAVVISGKGEHSNYIIVLSRGGVTVLASLN